MWVRGKTSINPRSMISSMTGWLTRAPKVSKTAWAHGDIFSPSDPGKYPSSCPPTGYKGRKITTFLWTRFSITASSPAHKARADFPVPARPPNETIPMDSSRSRSSAILCSALLPCKPNAWRSPRTNFNLLSLVTRARALPFSECRTIPV